MKLVNNQYELKITLNPSKKKNKSQFFNQANAERVRAFHNKFHQYQPTPLVELGGLAEQLGVSKILLKDESKRFGLNAFKVLGGAYAIARLLCRKLEMDLEQIDFDDLKTEEIRVKLGNVTFITATDGNHGRGIAWAAKELGQKAVIYMPKGSARNRIDNIEKLGARVIVTNLNYDDTVRVALEESEKHDWYMVQDTAWEGYEEIPRWIMQGYMTMAVEVIEQMKTIKPTHVILQAGVGAMAGAVAGYLSNVYDEVPEIIVVEPSNAACLYKTATIGDGQIHKVDGELKTIMAGLACGEPNPLGWSILHEFASAFISCGDYISGNGMRILANPIRGDQRVVSGESGAVGIGLLNLLSDDRLSEFRESLKIDSESVVLLFSTEGDTDVENYMKTIWEGKYSLVG